MGRLAQSRRFPSVMLRLLFPLAGLAAVFRAAVSLLAASSPKGPYVATVLPGGAVAPAP